MLKFLMAEYTLFWDFETQDKKVYRGFLCVCVTFHSMQTSRVSSRMPARTAMRMIHQGIKY